jgi:hypothetical protein
MRFHDYHLSKYEVSDYGETVTFHLVYDYPGRARDVSCISFMDVTLYHFIHASAAIILDIEEISIPNLLNESGSEIAEWSRMYGVGLWKDSLQNYSLQLQSEGYKAWRIESSIGFYGFVIGKAVVNA